MIPFAVQLLCHPVLKYNDPALSESLYKVLRAFPNVATTSFRERSLVALPFPVDAFHFNLLAGPQFLIPSSKFYEQYQMPTTEIDPKSMEEINASIAELRVSLDARIPEFGNQLQFILQKLQATPEAAWVLSKEDMATVIAGLKQNAQVTLFAKAAPVKRNNKPLTADDV